MIARINLFALLVLLLSAFAVAADSKDCERLLATRAREVHTGPRNLYSHEENLSLLFTENLVQRVTADLLRDLDYKEEKTISSFFKLLANDTAEKQSTFVTEIVRRLVELVGEPISSSEPDSVAKSVRRAKFLGLNEEAVIDLTNAMSKEKASNYALLKEALSQVFHEGAPPFIAEIANENTFKQKFGRVFQGKMPSAPLKGNAALIAEFKKEFSKEIIELREKGFVQTDWQGNVTNLELLRGTADNNNARFDLYVLAEPVNDAGYVDPKIYSIIFERDLAINRAFLPRGRPRYFVTTQDLKALRRFFQYRTAMKYGSHPEDHGWDMFIFLSDGGKLRIGSDQTKRLSSEGSAAKNSYLSSLTRGRRER